VRLYERYAESLPEGVERTRAAGIAETLRLFVGPISPDALAPRYAPRLVQRDHRMLSEWSATSPDEAVAHLCAAASVVGNSRGRVVDVVAAGPSAYLTHVVSTGTSADGVESERLFLSLNAYAPDGRVQHIEFFDEGREAEALARFARIEMFDSEERDTALARFEELRDGRP